MSDRTPYDGEPFYCTFCGSGLGEFYACEDVRCVLESKEAALARANNRKRKARQP